MTERLHFHFSLSCTGEGNGNPLQCSCLENPRDGGAWWAAVYGVAQSRTRLKRLSSSSSSVSGDDKCTRLLSHPSPGSLKPRTFTLQAQDTDGTPNANTFQLNFSPNAPAPAQGPQGTHPRPSLCGCAQLATPTPLPRSSCPPSARRVRAAP